MNTPTAMNTLSNWIKISFLALIMVAGIPIASASKVNIDSSNGLAIKGYDPVSYFVSQKPMEGKAEYTYEYQGAKWAFANVDNKNAFIENPEAYIPQYGGFCAFAASRNAIANTDPLAWTIVNNKLYLNYNTGVRSMWQSDQNNLIQAADKNWPALSK